MDKILFVCSGNTCRSPFAEKYFNKLARELNISSLAASAGLFTFGDETPSQNAITASAAFGVDKEMSHHRSTPITAEMLVEANYVLTMSKSHLELVKKAIEDGIPIKEGQIQALLGNGIEDPYGGSVSDYENCYKQISEAVKAFIEANYK